MPALPALITDATTRFCTGLTQALSAGASDTFSFELSLSCFAGTDLMKLAIESGYSPDSVMTIMCFIRPKDIADPLLDAMQSLREQISNVADTGDPATSN